MKRRIPVWVHVPWFLIALVGVIVWYPDDADVWVWQPGASVPFRLSLLALALWCWAGRWLADLSPATLRRISCWLLRRRPA